VNNIPELLRSSFFDFFIYVFHASNPNAELIGAPFQRYICDTYQNLDQGDRLVVNQPARTGKSLTARAYALWRIGRDPTEKIVILSNNIRLAEEHVYEARKIMRSAEYREIFPKTRIAKDRSAITHLQTTRGGGFFAGSMQSSLGGVGAKIMIIDDGNRIDDANNPENLEQANHKFDGEILSRINPIGKKKKRGIIVNVQHRLAENDLSAHLIANGFKCMAFPLEAPRTKTYRWADETWTREKGHVLLENFSTRELEKLRELQHPPYFYFYQQAQGLDMETAIKETHFRLLDRRNSSGTFVISIDTAQGDSGSFNVAQVWDVGDHPLHLRTQFREQCSFATFEYAVTKLITKFRPGAVLVENASNGAALISRLLECFPSMNFVPINPHGSKAERLARHRKTIAAGAISLQVNQPWLDDYIFEFVYHPKNGSDQVDATTQLLDWAPQNRRIAPSGPLHAGPAGAYASSLRHRFAFSSETPGIVRGINRRLFTKW
jgi:phage terminase large subunit-like protein